MPLKIELSKAVREPADFQMIGKDKTWTLLMGNDLKSDKIKHAKEACGTSATVVRGTCADDGTKVTFACKGSKLGKALFLQAIKSELPTFAKPVLVTSDVAEDADAIPPSTAPKPATPSASPAPPLANGTGAARPPASAPAAVTAAISAAQQVAKFKKIAQPALKEVLTKLRDNPKAAKTAAAMYEVGLQLAEKDLEKGLQAVVKLRAFGEATPATRPRKTQGPPTAVVPREIPVPEPTDEAVILDCERIILAEKSWKAVKKKYAGLKDKTQMQNLVGFRTKTVTATLVQVRTQFPDLIWKSVGSVTLTSDFDLTVSCPKSGNDAEAVLAFNRILKSRFGAQPGTVFDTNLYTQDYSAVKGNAALRSAAETAPAPPPMARTMERIAQAGQDVGSLMKQRRFMSWDEYDAYQQSVLGDMDQDAAAKSTQMDALIARAPDPAAREKLQAQKTGIAALLAERRSATEKQMEEADALYQLCQAKILKAKEVLEENEGTPADPDGPDPILDTDLDTVELEDTQEPHAGAAARVREQQSILEESEELESEDGDPDLHMEISNKLYVKAVREVRKLQAEMDALQAELNKPGSSSDHDLIREKIDNLLPVIKTKTSEATYFSNEGYQTEGPIQHVVVGNQGGDAAALAMISANQLLQSFNENMGDFLKDARHYANDDAGKGFIQASKYAERMMDAIVLLKQKLGMTTLLDFEKNYGAAPALKATLKAGLLALRKDLLQFPEVQENGHSRPLTDEELEEEKRIYAEQEVARIFKVSTLEALKGVFMGLNRELNAALRSKEFGDSLKPGKAEEKAYFGAAAGR